MPGAPASREGMPQDLNDWLSLLAQSGVIETLGDAGALFLIRVPALSERCKDGLADKVEGKLSETVLLRDGARYFEAVRMGAAQESEIFFDEPLGRLLSEDRHKEEIEELENKARSLLPRCFAWGSELAALRARDARSSLGAGLFGHQSGRNCAKRRGLRGVRAASASEATVDFGTPSVALRQRGAPAKPSVMALLASRRVRRTGNRRHGRRARRRFPLGSRSEGRRGRSGKEGVDGSAVRHFKERIPILIDSDEGVRLGSVKELS